MKGKTKTTIELDEEAVSAIIVKYFAEKKNIIIQEVNFNVGEAAGDYNDRYSTYEFKNITCTREDDIEL